MVGVMKRTPSPSVKRAITIIAATSLVALGAAAAGAPASAGSQSDPCSGPYGWPVKPFDRQHPIRGNFGDPRTVFDGRRKVTTILEGDGTFSFHQGVDISAPDGSRVYPVASGTVTFVSKHRLTVACANGVRAFQYWHLTPAVRLGQSVEIGHTVLGRIERKREHVHLTHLENRRAVNPLARGFLTPYRDPTTPRVLRLEIRGSGTRPGIGAKARGNVTFVAQTADVPSVPVPGRWHGFPVTPARLSWRLERSGRTVMSGIARDGRTVPKNAQFWQTYARGTYQNWPVFHGKKAQFVTGRYLFKLSSKPLDTRRLRNGVYELVVTARDAGGNSDVLSLRFTIDNGSDL